MTKTHEGWTNYETWNIALWIDNDYNTYNTYREKIDFLQYCEITPSNIERFVKDLFPSGTPDFESYREYTKVNWKEIAESWKVEKEG
jgi:hypothetical protein